MSSVASPKRGSEVENAKSPKRYKANGAEPAPAQRETSTSVELVEPKSIEQSTPSEPEAEPESSRVVIGGRPRSKPAWFYGNPENFEPLEWFMYRYKIDMGPSEVQRSMFDAVSVLLKNNYHFESEARDTGALMVVLDIKPEAHQAKGLHGKTIFTTRHARSYRSKLRDAMSKAFLPYWNFDTMKEPIIPLGSVICVEKLEFSYPYRRYHSKARAKREASAGDTKPEFEKITAPDLDNLMKPFFDAAEGLLFANDRQISELKSVSKIHSAKPGICLFLRWRQLKHKE